MRYPVGERDGGPELAGVPVRNMSDQHDRQRDEARHGKVDAALLDHERLADGGENENRGKRPDDASALLPRLFGSTIALSAKTSPVATQIPVDRDQRASPSRPCRLRSVTQLVAGLGA